MVVYILVIHLKGENMTAKDILVGSKFGHYTVIKDRYTDMIISKNGKTYWQTKALCVCGLCGATKDVDIKHLLNNKYNMCFNCFQEFRVIKDKEQHNDTNKLRCFNAYSVSARKRGIEFKLNLNEFEVLCSLPCVYCGIEPSNQTRKRYPKNHKHHAGEPRPYKPFVYSGIDRVNNDIGYIYSNCVPCCKTCNYAKSNLTSEEFFAWIDRIAKFRRYTLTK